MVALWIIGGIVLFFVLLLSLKFTVTVAYRDEVSLWVKVLFIKIPILPAKEKKPGPHAMSAKKAKKLRERLRQKQLKKAEAKRQKEEKKKAEKATAKEKPKKSVSDILDMISLIRKLLAKVIGKFWRHLRIDVARLKIGVATGDAAATAMAYGAITGAINTLFPLLEKVKNFDLPRDGDIEVTADFLGESIEADVELSFSLRVWHVFDVAFGALFTFLGHQFKKMQAAERKATRPTHDSTRKPQGRA